MEPHKINYILKNYLKISTSEIAEMLNIAEHNVRSIANRAGLTKRIILSDREYFNESWYEIDGFSKYLINESGVFIRKKDKVLIQWCYTIDGYPTIKLVDDQGIRRINRVHRLVAKLFVNCERSEYTEVNHIDGDKTNAHYSNLEWVTPSENQIHSYNLGLRKPANSYVDDKYIHLICSMIENGLTNDQIRDRIIMKMPKSLIRNIRAKSTHTRISKNYNF